MHTEFVLLISFGGLKDTTLNALKGVQTAR
jgi:hypothetical protein